MKFSMNKVPSVTTGSAQHHLTHSISTRLYQTSPTQPKRAQLPVATIYCLNEKVEVAHKQIKETVAPVPRRQSMFFKGHTAKMDEDPFLRRLSRMS